MDSDEQHNDKVMAEHQLSQQEEVRLDSEVIPTTSSPNSMDTYAVEASIQTRPKRTTRPPKHLDDYKTMFAQLLNDEWFCHFNVFSDEWPKMIRSNFEVYSVDYLMSTSVNLKWFYEYC